MGKDKLHSEENPEERSHSGRAILKQMVISISLGLLATVAAVWFFKTTYSNEITNPASEVDILKEQLDAQSKILKDMERRLSNQNPLTGVVRNTESPYPKQEQAGTEMGRADVHYTIKPKDTLKTIAKKFKVSEEDIFDANHNRISDPDKIESGKIIIIPMNKRDKLHNFKTVDKTNDPVQSEVISQDGDCDLPEAKEDENKKKPPSLENKQGGNGDPGEALVTPVI